MNEKDKIDYKEFNDAFFDKYPEVLETIKEAALANQLDAQLRLDDIKHAVAYREAHGKKFTFTLVLEVIKVFIGIALVIVLMRMGL